MCELLKVLTLHCTDWSNFVLAAVFGTYFTYEMESFYNKVCCVLCQGSFADNLQFLLDTLKSGKSGIASKLFDFKQFPVICVIQGSNIEHVIINHVLFWKIYIFYLSVFMFFIGTLSAVC